MASVRKTSTPIKTIVELLRDRAEDLPSQSAYLFISKGGTQEHQLTYAELDHRARAIAGFLQSMGQSGNRVLLFYPPGLEYICAFMGCLYAGMVAVPLYPPRTNQKLTRLGKVISSCGATLALTSKPMEPLVQQFLNPDSVFQDIRVFASEGLTDPHEWLPITPSENQLAFLQYTSGSTGTPKGVMVSHQNLMANEHAIAMGFETRPEDICLSWLPFYHDMGLIGTVLHALYRGFTSILMPPLDFIRNPISWLELMTRYKVTISGSPNFGYDLCVNRINEERLAELNLERWRIAFNGAEPVRAVTLQRFAHTFKPVGFSYKTFKPCYGMAEATLFITTDPPGTAPPTLSLNQRQLEKNQVVVESNPQESLPVVSNGMPREDHQLRIVHPESRVELSEGHIGEIWFQGPSVAQGYWGMDQETKETFQARIVDQGPNTFLRTGDLGFLHEGRLYVTGRIKDLIIIRGRNYYPQDLELTAYLAHAALRPNSAAFSLSQDQHEDQLVLVQEVNRQSMADLQPDKVIAAIRQAISEQHQVTAHTVVLVRPGNVPKTSSGKVQRRHCRELFLHDQLQVIHASNHGSNEEPTAEPVLSRETLLASPHRLALLLDWLTTTASSVLKIPKKQITAETPLTSLGLDSMMAIELEHRLASDLGLAMPMADILNGHSLQQLATTSLGNAAPAKTPLIQLDTQHLPLSPNQAALWFLDRLAPDSAAYNISFCVNIRSGMNQETLTLAFQTLIQRHPSLRTTFHTQDGTPFQRIHDFLLPEIHREDGRTWDSEQIQAFLNEKASTPFNLETGPLLRLCFLRQKDGRYLWLFTIHHIIADFWSILVLMQEFQWLYSNQAKLLPSLPGHFGHYIARQESFLGGSEGAKQAAYWEKQLGGRLPVLEMHTDYPRPALQTYRGDAEFFSIDDHLTQALQSMARDHQTTLYTLLLATFQVLLSRYSQQEDVVVGSPTAGRQSADWKDVVGYFVNPVALRGDLRGNPRFSDHLALTRQRVTEALAHSDVPFEILVERLQPERDPSRTPIFQSMFVLQQPHTLEDAASFALRRSGARINLGGLELESYPLDQRVSPFDLTLVMIDTGDALAASLEYNADLFTPASMRRLTGHFSTLLASIVSQPDGRLNQLSHISDKELEQLATWNHTHREFPSDECFHQRFEALVDRLPQAPAINEAGNSLTYCELNQRANQLGHQLKLLGIGAESIVGICMNRSANQIIALLAVLKAGGAFLPLDPDYPAERLRFMLEDAGVEVILTLSQIVLPESSAHTIHLDENTWDHPLTNLESSCFSENRAYVIYTSGSTGRPKGVEISHVGLANVVREQIRRFGLGPGKRVSQFASLSFDASIWECVMALGSGACLCPLESPLVGEDLAAFFQSQKITHTTLTPSVLAQLPQQSYPHLEVVIAAGEACSPDFICRHSKHFFNAYGPTESTICTTMAAYTEPASRITIGKPLSNFQVHLLDHRGHLVGAGLRGELCIGGAGLARGYLRQPALTAEKFIPNPFSQQSGSRLYRSGDLCRLDGTENLEFLGRLDHQVKVRGYRIELNEIETLLSQVPQVKQAVVLVHGQYLVAFVVLHRGLTTAQDLKPIRERLQRQLPGYMVPAVFRILDQLPVTPNGKLDRDKLLAMGTHQQAEIHHEPQTDTQRQLASIWCQVLEVDRVGLNDHFFSLGGHSLLATQVVSRIRTEMNLDIPLNFVFLHPHLKALSEAIEPFQRHSALSRLPALEPRSNQRRPPLSFAQERLWFLEQLNGPSATYNMPARVELQGHLNLAALSFSLNQIRRRHESLRTNFLEKDGKPELVLHAHEDSALTLIECQDLDDLEHFCHHHAATPFDLASDALLKVTLIRQKQDHHTLLINMHHIISDGWSVSVFIRELVEFYTAYHQNKPASLNDLSLQYGDYASWHRQVMESDTLHYQLDYWKHQLDDASTQLDLPMDRLRSEVRSFEGDSLHFEVPADLLTKLQAQCQQQDVTLFQFTQAVFAVLLHRYTRQDDILVGTPIANRNQLGVEPLVGFLANTLVIRNRLHGDPSFAEFLQRVHDTTLDAYMHQDVPFDQVVDFVQPERDTRTSPLFQVMFSFQNTPLTHLELPDLDIQWTQVNPGTSRFDLTLSLQTGTTSLQGRWEYALALFDKKKLETITQHYLNLLTQAVTHPETPISRLAMVTQEEHQQLLHRWQPSASQGSPNACLHRLIEAQVARTPEATAILGNGKSLHFSELNRQANQLAHYLRERGLQPEQPVAVLMARGPRWITAMLAILKAGGCYVPLDLSHPRNRLQQSLDHCHGVLTESAALKRIPHHPYTMTLDTMATTLAGMPDHNPNSRVSPDHLAYIIYTSGSTGAPKGIEISHRNLCHYLLWSVDAYGLKTGSGSPIFGSMAFDATHGTLWGPLLAGRWVDMVPEGDELEQLLNLLAEPSPYHAVHFSPAHLSALQRLSPPNMTWDLKHLVVGGEALFGEKLTFWRDAVPTARLVNQYGPSETTVACCAYGFDLAEVVPGPVPIGKPIGQTRLYIVEPGGSLAPTGVPGELLIGGASVARSYVNQPGLTAQRFVPDPFSGSSGARLFRSGDLVCNNADDQLIFLGRMDQQVKLRGFRMELGEIETVLAGLPQVAEAGVIVAREKLIAFVVPQSNIPLVHEDLTAKLALFLPDYMIPTTFISLDALPLNANGKLDRKALASHDFSQNLKVNPHGQLQTPNEQILARLFGDLLDCGPVSREDHFFQLGGHSLLATQLVSRIRSAFEVELPLREIFTHPKLKALAQAIEVHASRPTLPLLPPVMRRPDGEAIQLTSGQERLWFLYQLEGPNANYNLPAAIRLRGSLDRKALKQSLNDILQRHQVLRTNFSETSGLPVATIAKQRNFPLTYVAASKVDPTTVQELMAEEASRPFNLAQDSLIRGRLLFLAPQDHLLMVTVHHIVSDGWSQNIFIRELSEFYQAYVEKRPPRLDPLVLQVPDVAHWQRQVLTGQMEQEKAYWQQQLADAPTFLTLPTDRPRPTTQTSNGALLHFDLPSAVIEDMDAFATKQHATRFMVLEAAFACLLQRYSGQADFLVGFPIAGRNRTEMEPLIGFFVNTLVLRNRIRPQEAFHSLVAGVKQDVLDAYAHQNLPFEQVVEMIQPERSTNHAPLFQVMFILQNQERVPITLGDIEVEICQRSDRISHFDLTLCLQETADGIGGYFEYNVDLFDRQTIHTLCGRFQTLLKGLLTHWDKPMGTVSLLDHEGMKHLKGSWNGPQQHTTELVAYHPLFEEQATLKPMAPALVWGDTGQTISYAELNQRADRLARQLASQGAGQGDFVAICLNRHAGLIVALLAVQKIGAAYVPLDPAYPEDRLAWILADAAPQVIISELVLAELIEHCPSPQLVVDADGFCDDIPEAPIEPVLVPGLLSHLIYTSGSTGKPKGVAITRRGVIDLVRWSESVYEQDLLHGVLASTSVCFDLSVFEIMVTLCRGGMVILVENILNLAGHPAANQVQLINTVPSAITELRHLDALPTSVRCINLAGEPLHRSLTNDLYAQPHVERVINLYGPSEDTTYSTVALIEANDTTAPLIGTPLLNTKALVLDELGQPVPFGMAGELYLGGNGLASGYFRQPGLTAAAFLPDAFATSPGSRLYRTGDLVCAQPTSQAAALAFLGRRDRQIKLRGFRIELDEIEACLSLHPHCREAAVILHSQPSDQLIAYVTLHESAPETAGDTLRDYVSKKLPSHMVPTWVLALEQLPQLPNGKIDRSLLTKIPLPRRVKNLSALVPPRNETEQRIATIWRDLLNLEEVGVHDNFFDLGGHSLLATRIIAHIRDQLGAQLPLARLFEDPTIAGLAKLIDALQWATTEPVLAGATDDFEDGEI